MNNLQIKPRIKLQTEIWITCMRHCYIVSSASKSQPLWRNIFEFCNFKYKVKYLCICKSQKSLEAHPMVSAGFPSTSQSPTLNWLTINRTFNLNIRCIKFKYSPNFHSAYIYKIFAPAGHKEMNIKIVTLYWNSLFEKYEDHKTISLKSKLTHQANTRILKPTSYLNFSHSS